VVTIVRPSTSHCPCRMLLGHYEGSRRGAGEPGVRERQVTSLTLECLAATITIATTQHHQHLDKFLDALGRIPRTFSVIF